MDLSIIIVSYNVRYFLEQCLFSIYGSKGNFEYEVFVVDNASKDGSVNYIRNRFPHREYPTFHVIENVRNVGFGRANNQALERAKGKYVLFLNPDTLLTENTLADCLTFAESHEDLGALGVMMLQTNGLFANESRRGLPTPWTAFCKMSGLASLFPKSRIFGRYYMRYLDKEQPSEIEIVSGAFMLLKNDSLKRLGGFDEQFFMYGEDIDLSYRMLRGGMKNYYLPTPMLHYKGESTQKSSFRYVHVFYGAMLIFFKKYYHHYAAIFSIPIKMAILAKALMALMSGMFHQMKHFLHPEKEIKLGTQLYVGPNGKQMRHLAQSYGIDVTVMPGDESCVSAEDIARHIPKGCVHVIFDTSCFSYTYILEYFRQSNHKYFVGTYNPQTGRMITDSYVLSPVKE